MSHKIFVERTVYVAKCTRCNSIDIKENSAPRQRYCLPCGEWVDYKKEFWVGQEKFAKE